MIANDSFLNLYINQNQESLMLTFNRGHDFWQMSNICLSRTSNFLKEMYFSVVAQGWNY